MSQESPIEGPLPNECPQCHAKVKVQGRIYDQKKAIAMKLAAGVVLVVGTGLGIGGIILFVGEISAKLMLVGALVGIIPAAIVFTVANAIPKIKEVKCSKCRWSDHYFVVVKNAGG
jgi:hypothetical protein